MKITYQWLEQHGACRPGINWFKERFPYGGCNLTLTHDLKRWNKEYMIDMILLLASDEYRFSNCRTHECTILEAELYEYLTGHELPPAESLNNYESQLLFWVLQGLTVGRLRKCLRQVAEMVREK